MKICTSARCSLTRLVAVGLLFGAAPFAMAAVRSDTQSAEDMRGRAAAPSAMNAVTASNLAVSVIYQGKPVYKAKVSIHSMTGASVASGVTSRTGVFSAPLQPGSYAVAASSKGHVATNNLTMDDSGKSLTLTLQ